MTRLQRELSGELGSFWKNDAEKRIAKTAKEFEERKITVDENYVLRNCIGRVVTSEIQELIFAGVEFAMDEYELIYDRTNDAREEETRKFFEVYKASQKEYTDEDLFEMRAAFGKGTKVVNILTGREVIL